LLLWPSLHAIKNNGDKQKNNFISGAGGFNVLLSNVELKRIQKVANLERHQKF
jgi:hypothetical protein